MKDLGHSFVTFLKVLDSSSGKGETLEFDDRFTKFDDFSEFVETHEKFIYLDAIYMIKFIKEKNIEENLRNI